MLADAINTRFVDWSHIWLSFQACSATETAKPGFDPTHRQSANCQRTITVVSLPPLRGGKLCGALFSFRLASRCVRRRDLPRP